MIPDVTDDGETKAESLARTTPDEVSATNHLIFKCMVNLLEWKKKKRWVFFDKHKGEINSISCLQEKMPRDGPELQEQRELRKTFDSDWSVISSTITGMTQIDPIVVDVNAKSEDSGKLVTFSEDEILKDCVMQMERKFVIIKRSQNV